MKRRMNHPGPAASRLDITVPDPDQPSAPSEVDYLRWISQMQADLAESLGGVMLQGCRPVPVGTATAGAVQLSNSAGRLVGWSLHETGGTDGFLVRFHDGTSADDTLIGCAAGAAGAVANQWWAPGGLSFQNGLFVEIVSGGSLSTAVEGTAYLGAAE